MARIRNIKPQFWDSPSTAKADLAPRLAFIAMWNWADDSGRGTANLKELEAFCFPNDDVADLPRACSNTSAYCAANCAGKRGGCPARWRNFAEILGEVADAYGVVFYRVHDRPYFIIPSFQAHQSKDFKPRSKHPGPEDGEIIDVTSGNVINSAASADSSANCAPSRGTSRENPETAAEATPGVAEIGLLDRDTKRGRSSAKSGEDPTPDQNHPPQSLDELAAQHAQTTATPDTWSTPDDPRCKQHAGLPRDQVPACWQCKQAKAWFKTHQEEKPSIDRAAIEACSLCDENGIRTITTPDGPAATRCNHQPDTEEAPPWELPAEAKHA